jgi:REP element-mobilizing transposase RayT
MSYVQIYVHAVWSTKYRDSLITKELKPLLLTHMMSNAKKKKIYLDQINCYKDHCHVLLSLGRTQSIAHVVQLLKGESSHWVNDHHLIKDYFDWQNEYYAASVSKRHVPIVRAYIKNQEEHHRRKSFQEEYDYLTKNAGF